MSSKIGRKTLFVYYSVKYLCTDAPDLCEVTSGGPLLSQMLRKSETEVLLCTHKFTIRCRDHEGAPIQGPCWSSDSGTILELQHRAIVGAPTQRPCGSCGGFSEGVEDVNQNSGMIRGY